MIPEAELKYWKDRVDLRDQWEAFVGTEAFEQGIKVLEAYNRPEVHPNESLQAMAMRQSFQAGYEAALFRLRQIHELPKAHVKIERTVEWGPLVHPVPGEVNYNSANEL